MKKKALIIVAVIIIVLVFWAKSFFCFLNVDNNCDIGKLGIIDTDLGDNMYDNVTYSKKTFSEKGSHGNELLDFIFLKGFKNEIYYFSAESSKGEINSSNILEGLEWMVENNVSIVNISLSSKFYSSELDNWIINHPEIQIYASYNNKLNTSDYPAMYSEVIASGADDNIEYKEIDERYASNQIVLWNHGIHFFHGNSFLTVETIFERSKNE